MATPHKIKSAEELAEKVEAYFKHCADSRTERELKNGDVRVRQELPSMVGLQLWLDIDDNTIYNWLDGKYSVKPELSELTNDIKDILVRARKRMELELLTAATNGDANDRVAMSRLAKYGYSEKRSLELNKGVTLSWQGVSDQDASDYSK